MDITSAQYQPSLTDEREGIKAIIDGEILFVPIDTDNRHYAEIMRQVDEGSLTIAEAE